MEKINDIEKKWKNKNEQWEYITKWNSKKI